MDARNRAYGSSGLRSWRQDMNTFKPDGRRTVTPRVITDDVAGLVGCLKIVFGAGGAREAMPAFLYVYVENADETYQRAIAAGAQSIERPADMPYGDRRAMVRDSWGNVWQIATYRGR